ncbi:MAG: winged helix-turn-helix transcriptional regulator [Deltaproteobacteria bacterium]|nr:winged helix-turn-helix transcriptional regulator [Deltaproteobacteria bacterium]
MSEESHPIRDGRDIFDIHAEFCGLFSNPARLRIVWTLSEGERTVGDLAQQLGLPASTLSGHLRKLRDKGVVETRREGSNIHYYVVSGHFLKGCLEIRAGILEVLRRSESYFE